jgi:hypothetical protein
LVKKNKKSKKGKPEPNKGGVREGAGRPPLTPDEKFWQDAEELAHMQCTRDEIAGFLKVDSDTLVSKIKAKYEVDFSAWYSKFSFGGKASLRRRLYHQAMEDGKDSVKAAIWLSKNYLGMKDNSNLNINTEKPIALAYALDESEDVSST